MDKFKDIFKKSFSQYVNDLMNEKFKSLMEPNAKSDVPATAEPVPAELTEPRISINTTADELECLIIIKTLLHEVIPAARLTYKDTQNYFSILLDGKVTRWICRLQLDGDKKWLIIPDAEKNQSKYEMASNDDLYQYKKEIQESAARVKGKD